MKLRHAVALLATVVLSACGSGKQDGIVRFNGSAPFTSRGLAKDSRSYSTFCPGPCGEPMAVDTTLCPNPLGLNILPRSSPSLNARLLKPLPHLRNRPISS